jgi:putative hemolysin
VPRAAAVWCLSSVVDAHVLEYNPILEYRELNSFFSAYCAFPTQVKLYACYAENDPSDKTMASLASSYCVFIGPYERVSLAGSCSYVLRSCQVGIVHIEC